MKGRLLKYPICKHGEVISPDFSKPVNSAGIASQRDACTILLLIIITIIMIIITSSSSCRRGEHKAGPREGLAFREDAEQTGVCCTHSNVTDGMGIPDPDPQQIVHWCF